jgi:hypothetical protein
MHHKLCGYANTHTSLHLGVDDEDASWRHADSPITDFISVTVPKASVEGVPLGGKQRLNFLEGCDFELMGAAKDHLSAKCGL